MAQVEIVCLLPETNGYILYTSWSNKGNCRRRFVYFMAQHETICALHGTTGDALHLVEETGGIFTLLEKL